MHRQSDRQRRQRLVGQPGIAHPEPQEEFVDFSVAPHLAKREDAPGHRGHGQQGDHNA